MSKLTNSQVLLSTIKSLSIEYKMELDWKKINKADEKELEHILNLMKTIYKLR
jgi:hypothetical protein